MAFHGLLHSLHNLRMVHIDIESRVAARLASILHHRLRHRCDPAICNLFIRRHDGSAILPGNVRGWL